MYGLGRPAPKKSRTHVLVLNFGKFLSCSVLSETVLTSCTLKSAFDATRSDKDDRREQFRLVSGALKPQSEVINSANWRAQHKDMLDKFDQSPGGKSGAQEIGPVVAIGKSKDGGSIAFMGSVWDTRNAPIPLTHLDVWYEFAKRALQGPIPRSWADIYMMREAELAQQ